MKNYGYEIAQQDVLILGAIELAQYSMMSDQNVLPAPTARLSAARMDVAERIGIGHTIEPEGEVAKTHRAAFLASRPIDIYGEDANMLTIRDGVAFEIDMVAMLLLEKYGFDNVQVPSQQALAALVVRSLHAPQAEATRKAHRRENGVVAGLALAKALPVVKKIIPKEPTDLIVE